MAYEVEKLDRYLWVRHTGEIDLNEVMAAIEETVAIAHKIEIYRFLVDLSKATPKMGTMDIFRICSSYPEVFPPQAKIAHLVSPLTNRPMEDRQFASDVALNRGSNIRFFDDFDEAVAWLT